jgi:hypothetical protein
MPADAFIQRHPRWSAALLLLSAVTITLGLSELAARYLLSYEPGYYTAKRVADGALVYSSTRAAQGELTYPYGTIKINSFGFPDEEFALEDDRPRIGYIGDSVTFGVGAGYGYRITEILEEYYPGMQHMNMSHGLGAGVTARTIEEVLGWSKRFRLNKVVYLLNLNDISPGTAATRDEPSHATTLIKSLEAKLDALRGRIYLYTWARNSVKTFMLAHGVGVQGISYELYPRMYVHVIEETAARVNYLGRALRRLGVELIVVLLPYEMQISEEAERVYRERRVKWGDGFIEGLTQRKLSEHLHGMRVFNALEAFVGRGGQASDRKANRVGQYFVHDRGGRLDWNHPERMGHRRIAEYLAQSAIFGRPDLVLATPSREP